MRNIRVKLLKFKEKINFICPPNKYIKLNIKERKSNHCHNFLWHSFMPENNRVTFKRYLWKGNIIQ